MNIDNKENETKQCAIPSVIISAFSCKNTGVTDSKGNEIIESDLIEDVLNSGKIGVVKYGLYFNCFDKKQVKDFGGHIGFYVDFSDEKIRKDLYYWAKNSIVVSFKAELQQMSIKTVN